MLCVVWATFRWPHTLKSPRAIKPASDSSASRIVTNYLLGMQSVYSLYTHKDPAHGEDERGAKCLMGITARLKSHRLLTKPKYVVVRPVIISDPETCRDV